MFRPLFYIQARAEARRELRRRGLTVAESFAAVAHADDTLIDAAVQTTGGPGVLMGAVGDGSILERLIAFFKSDAGRALVKLILTLLLGFADDGEDGPARVEG